MWEAGTAVQSCRGDVHTCVYVSVKDVYTSGSKVILERAVVIVRVHVRLEAASQAECGYASLQLASRGDTDSAYRWQD